MRDLLCGVDVKGRAVLGGEGGEIGFVAVERAVAVGERTGGGGWDASVFLVKLRYSES